MFQRFRVCEKACDGASGVYPSFSQYFVARVYSNFEAVACYNLSRNGTRSKGV